MKDHSISQSTIARMAGNIAAGMLLAPSRMDTESIARLSVRLARAIVHQIEAGPPPAAATTDADDDYSAAAI